MFCSLGVGIYAGGAFAEPLTLPTQGQYTVIRQNLPDALKQFFDDIGIRVSIDPGVEGNIRSGFTADTPKAFLDALSSEYRLDWYYDGNVVYITPAAASITHELPLAGVSYTRLVAALGAQKILDQHYTVRPESGDHTVAVFGPPRFVDRVAQVIHELGVIPDHHTIRIFRGSEIQQIQQ